MIFVDDIEKLTLENTDYRRVIFTSDYSQLVLMSIPVGDDIELEIHPYVDQFFRIEQGNGEVIIGKEQIRRYNIKDRTGLIVPHNTYHRIVNTGNVPLKLYSIYSPPNHPPTRIDRVKPLDDHNHKNENKYKNILVGLLTIL